MRKTIPYRKTLTPDIFTEMTENYPITAVDGREYKQELKYFSVPSDFDFVQFRFDCEDNDLNVFEAYSLWSCLMAQMCLEYGYYCDYTKALVYKISSALGITSDKFNDIINTLIDMGYLYNFDGRLTCIPVVRTFEVVQSTRISNRSRKKPYKTNENAAVINDNKTDDNTPEALDDIEINDEERKFWEEKDKVENKADDVEVIDEISKMFF